jgi:RNA polymerase sigma-70 factor (ECF subfamily)
VSQDELYEEASATYQKALERLARAYEADPDKRNDLLQDIHLELWRSFATYDHRCSMRTWVYRVAQNASASYVLRQRRMSLRHLVSLDDLELEGKADHTAAADNRLVLGRLLELVHRLKPLDRQIMLLYLEDMDAASIGEITGISAGYVRTQIHRIKAILARRFHGGAQYGE